MYKKGGIRLEGILKKRFCNFHYPALKAHIVNANTYRLDEGVPNELEIEEYILQCWRDRVTHERSRLAVIVKKWRANARLGLRPEQKLDIALRYAFRMAGGECRRINLKPLGIDSFDTMDEDTAWEEYAGMYE